jgi:hypothetical protein
MLDMFRTLDVSHALIPVMDESFESFANRDDISVAPATFMFDPSKLVRFWYPANQLAGVCTTTPP